MREFKFENRTAVITGAASGIGLELAKRAAHENMNLVLADIEESKLQDAIAQIEINPNRVTSIKIDVSLEEDIKKLADLAFKQFGGVHLLCNNAGVGMNRTTWDHSHADWQWVLGVNLFSVTHAIRHFVPRMLNQAESSHIVNTASVAGLLSTSGMSAYNASKHGVVTISETLYHELQSLNSLIGISVLCPAWVTTGIHTSHRNRPDRFGIHASPPEGLSSSYEDRMGKAVHSGRLSAKDMALAVFEAVKENQFYVIPHRKINHAIELRMKDVLELRNPTPLE
ncbi:MAG: SDR family NAD(P)-dependent oxidoreductase [Betaproteobacteria bacterium]|jgi:short-subunit dehydrogenase